MSVRADDGSVHMPVPDPLQLPSTQASGASSSSAPVQKADEQPGAAGLPAGAYLDPSARSAPTASPEPAIGPTAHELATRNMSVTVEEYERMIVDAAYLARRFGLSQDDPRSQASRRNYRETGVVCWERRTRDSSMCLACCSTG